MTAVANDFGYNYTYSRMIEAIGNEHDILFAISTSGNSKNVINAIKKAKEKSMITIGLLGKNKTIMNDYYDITINIPSYDTAEFKNLTSSRTYYLSNSRGQDILMKKI